MNDRPKQFLPGTVGADTPIVDVTPQGAEEGNGPVAGLTTNYSLNLVNFDWITWHNYEWDNWQAVDALLQVAIGFLNIVGVWRPQTDYIVGQTVIDPEDLNKLWLCETNHTSGTQFDQVEKDAYWSLRQSADPNVTSVFGRIGDIVAEEEDYAAFYYKKAEVDASQAAQDTVINSNTANIQTNTANIATNATNIETNTTDIGINKTAIDNNTAAITTNTTNIAQNTSDIAQNTANILVRTRWRNEWSDAVTYEANDMVRDGSYLVVANTQNLNDKPITEQEPAYPGADANTVPQTPVNEQVYWTGQEYFIQDARYVDGFRFYTPSGGFEFTVIYRVRNEDGTLQKVKQASAWQTYVTDGWKELTLPTFLVLEGQRIEVWLGTRAVAQTSEVTGPWTTTNRNGGVPAAGEAYFRNDATEIQFNVIDGNAVDRTTDLASIPVGASFDFGGLSWTVNSVTSDASTYTFIIQPGQGRPAEGTYTFEWEWGSPDPLPYVADTTFWQNNQNIRGSVGTAIVDDMTETDAQYGVDILSRQVQISDNWDIMALSGVSGGGGGAPGGGDGASVTTGPVFPDVPSPGDLHYLTVETVGLYVYYDDGNSKQWVQTNGGSTGGAPGSVLQVVQTHVTTTSSQVLTANVRTNINGLNATITPRNANSRIRVSVRWNGEGSSIFNQDNMFGIRRGTADIGNPASPGNRASGIAVLAQGYWDSNANSTPDSAIYEYVDSPGTASPITYHATIRVREGQTLYNQRSVLDSDNSSHERITSTIILEEIAG